MVFASGGVGLAIGPGWSKGLTYFPRGSQPLGTVIASTDGANSLPANIYLRPIQDGWFVFYERDED
jgi:hypothetical protein